MTTYSPADIRAALLKLQTSIDAASPSPRLRDQVIVSLLDASGRRQKSNVTLPPAR